MKQIIDALKKLIEFQSTSNKPKENLKCLQLIEKLFSDDFFIIKYSFQSRPMIVLSNTKDKKVDFILAGHVDVVPDEIKNFKLKIKDRKFFGRGVSDMKGPLIAAIFAIRDYLKNNNQIKVAVFVTSDEEIDGLSTEYLLGKKGYRARFAILPDGGNGFEIVTQQKGFLQVKISITGKSSHAARPWKAVHPFDFAVSLYETLHKEFPMLKSERDWKTSVSLTKIEGGEALNQIPACLNLYFDIRYVRQKDKDKFYRVIKDVLRTKYRIETIAENAQLITKSDNFYIRALKECVEKITHKRAIIIRECGTSDAAFFAEYGVPAVLLKPRGGQEHQRQEWIDKDSLFLFYEIILDFLENFSDKGGV